MAEQPIVGTNGSDTLIGDEGDDLIIGNSATADADLNATQPVDASPETLAAAVVSAVASVGSAGAATIDAAAALPSLDALIAPAAPVADQGAEGNDTLVGTDGGETIRGRAGNDVIDGGLGNDVMRGGSGGDQLIWNPKGGNDRFFGGSGQDESLINAGADAEVFNLQATPDGAQFERLGDKPFTVDMRDTESVTLNALDGDDRFNVAALDGSGVSTVRFNAGGGNDVLDASQSDVATVARGGAGDDTIQGGSGNDLLRGGTGNDTINSGAGDDTIRLGQGQDTVQFATGEVFDPSAVGQDRVRDFQDGDKVALSKTTFQALTSEEGEDLSGSGNFETVDSASQVERSDALFVYNKESGELFYNSNRDGEGLGRGGKEAFAVFEGNPDLQDSDFYVES